ncbi:cell division protein FtsQ [Pseudoxanthomonas broegbernensis]|uniref:Cell division protein FtsQ n=1 Tax=Pseudoxanthomonas broegbernensis TaxID=83619 RepID=A0A7V8K6K5_9GAMM|nr:cell division protein FtsQ/DivIB [Pseudoxanthomonas broegbernensis]KAF1686031.1 cell division protein FtsQ [Pseudoxanthomonas broegbernensis]MBB6063712.1 cell division protein FtsQ [Pseudoxanthomonas broegbernensis]
MNAVLRILAWLLAVALVAAPVVAVLNGWVGAERWPLSRLRVTGQFERVQAEQVRQVLAQHARTGYFAVRLSQAQRAVEQLPWVESAVVRKQWPDVLEVQVVEHRPFARWGTDRLLSERGRLFPLPQDLADAHLPWLDGPDARTAEVVALYDQTRALFAPLGYGVARLGMDARGSWSLVLDNGTVVVIGRHDARARLARFVRVLPQLLVRHARPLQRADLRYTNGFALEWAKPGAGTGGRGTGGAMAAAAPVRRAFPGPASTTPVSRFPFPVPGSQT